MRQSRADVRPSTSQPEPVNPHQDQAQGPPRFIDRNRPYHEEDRYSYPAYLVQNGYWYHWKTGELVGKAG